LFLVSSTCRTLSENKLENSSVLEVLSCLSSTVCCQESLPSNEISSFSLGALINTSENGCYSPEYGILGVENALIAIIQRNHGIIIKDVSVKSLDLEVLNEDEKGALNEREGEQRRKKWKATGITISSENENEIKDSGLLSIKANQSVISGLGTLSSYSTLIPSDAISDETKNYLSLLQEKRPQVKVIFWIGGTKEELSLSSLNYYEMNSNSSSSFSSSCFSFEEKHSSCHEKLATSYCHMWSPSAQDPRWTSIPERENYSIIIIEYEITEPTVSLEQLNWNSSTSSTSFSSSYTLTSVGKGPSLFVSKRDPVTNPNHSDYGLYVGGRKLQLTNSQKDDYQRQGELLLRSLYPLTYGKIRHCHVEEPTLGGCYLSNQSTKYSTSLSVQTEVEVISFSVFLFASFLRFL
jgi:hypothetical protein